MNIPIFRAKKLDSDEYVIGYLEEHNTNDFYISLIPNGIYAYKIDTSTLSIHFPDMLDSQRNKIFASLQEDGKGGDIVIIKDTTFEYTYKYIKGRFMLGECMDLLNPFLLFEQIGIQE